MQENMQVPLPNVSSSVLVKVLEYCEHHKNEPLPAPDANDQDDSRRKTAEIGDWDSKFIVSRPALARSCGGLPEGDSIAGRVVWVWKLMDCSKWTRRCCLRSSLPRSESRSLHHVKTAY
jgi:hypothetical protein